MTIFIPCLKHLMRCWIILLKCSCQMVWCYPHFCVMLQKSADDELDVSRTCWNEFDLSLWQAVWWSYDVFMGEILSLNPRILLAFCFIPQNPMMWCYLGNCLKVNNIIGVSDRCNVNKYLYFTSESQVCCLKIWHGEFLWTNHQLW